MIGVYFSGTGNTKYCVEYFLNCLGAGLKSYSIEDFNIKEHISKSDIIVLGYPIYFSNLPKIMRDFLNTNGELFKDKKIFIISTMGLFSGDGTGCSSRVLKKYGANIIGGLHLKMPDCISDEKALKKSIEGNLNLISNSKEKIANSATLFKENTPTQEGLSFLYHIAGLFGQRLWFYNKTKNYSNKLKINTDLCVGCGKCVSICPMKNLTLEGNKPITHSKCTMCYRCVHACPKEAITLLGKNIIDNFNIDEHI